MGYRELLRSQPGFRRLWLGQLVSQAGDWLQLIALLRLFPTSGQGAFLLAGMFIVRVLPTMIWAPFAGVVADRFPRGRVMVACDLLRAVIVLAYLFVRGPEDVIWIYALQFIQESVTTFFEPARSAAVPQVVERRALLAANSLAGATWSAMLAFGSALGGVITGTLGARAAFIADAATFVASAILIGGVKIPKVVLDAEAALKRSADRFGFHALRDGIAYLRENAPQAIAASVKGLWGMAGGVFFLYSIYAGEVFTAKGGDPARATGILYAGRGIGALMGPLVARRIFGESVRALRRGVQIGYLLAATAYVVFAFSNVLWLGVLMVIVAHAGGSTCWVNSTQLLQLTVPNRLQGRAFAVELALFTLAQSLSSLAAGYAVGHTLTSTRNVALAMASLALLAGGIWFVAMRKNGAKLEAASADR
jgi:predicted MFS family arabinose efflux permease